MLVAVFEDERCQKHLSSGTMSHRLPEVSDRVSTISNALRNAPFFPKLKFFTPTAATAEDLQSIHKKEHIAHVSNQVFKASQRDGLEFVDRNPDVIVSAGSELAAQLAAGAVRDAVKLVMDPGNGIKRAFCNIRPPGHHAQCARASGFCLFNNVWFGAQEARKIMADAKIAIVDIDLHHGDGTEDFVRRNTKLFTYFVSIHQTYNTNFPGTGKEAVKRRENSVMINHNIKPGEGDEKVKKYFNEFLLGDLSQWKPDLIFISCGFDAHVLDDIGQLEYSSELYGWISRRLSEVAERFCRGRLISVLEGGYNMKALAEASVEHVQGML